MSARVKHQHMDRPVHQPQPMHFASGLAADDLIALIDDIENLFRHQHPLNLRSTGGRVEQIVPG